jgi:hypothetical protein
MRAAVAVQQQGKSARVVNPNPVLLRLLAITGLDGDAPFDLERN